MDAGFRTQHAEAVFAGQFDRCGLDAGDVTFGFFEHVDGVALAFAVFDVHAQQHRGPVLRFRAASAGLNVDEAIERVGRVVEHAAELKRGNGLLDFVDVGGNGIQRVVVVLLARHRKQLIGILEAIGYTIERQDDVLERLLLFAQFLRALGVVPDLRVFEFARNGVQLIEFLIVVKDTSATRWRAGRDPRVGW